MQDILTEKEIISVIERKFGKYMKNFTLKLADSSEGINPHVLDFQFSYETALDNKEQSVSDGVDASNTKDIIERVWLSLIAATENSDEKEKIAVRKSIIEAGESLGLISPEHRGR